MSDQTCRMWWSVVVGIIGAAVVVSLWPAVAAACKNGMGMGNHSFLEMVAPWWFLATIASCLFWLGDAWCREGNLSKWLRIAVVLSIFVAATSIGFIDYNNQPEDPYEVQRTVEF